MKAQYALLTIALYIFPVLVSAETVRDFKSTITVNTDRSIQVEENISYDFGENERRGIYRTIPLRGINIKGDIQTLHNSKPATQDISRGGDITIKIGDEDIYLTGLNQYSITYQVKGVIEKLQDRDELYWQITGNKWEVPIEQASATILLPADLQDKVGDTLYCYTGISSSTAQDCTITWTNARTIEIKSNQSLAAGEGLNFAIGFPLGTLTPPTWWEENQELIYKSIAGVILVIGSLILYFVWNTWARDPKIRTPIVRQYDAPKGMSPAAIIRFKNTYSTPVEISATIISLAQQGILNITQIEEKKWFSNGIYQFDLKDIPKGKTLKPFEQELLGILFKGKRKTVTTKDLTDEHIGDKFNIIYKSIYRDEVKQYFAINPNIPRSILGVIVVGLFILAFIIGVFISGWIAISLNILAILAAISAFYAPKRTEEGTRVLEHILGLEEYIRVAEKDRLQFQEKEYIFFEILPFAIALGLATVWAKAFEGLITANPDWYTSHNGVIFIPTDFVSSIDSSLSSTMSSASSGGGSAGGGSGGGGGGSW
jgi:uncharacterized membrane protein YgcG